MGLYFYDALQTSSLSQSLLFAWPFNNYCFVASGAWASSAFDWGPLKMTASYWTRFDSSSPHNSGGMTAMFRTGTTTASFVPVDGGIWQTGGSVTYRLDMPSFSASNTGAFNLVSADKPWTIVAWYANQNPRSSSGTKNTIVGKWNSSASGAPATLGGWAFYDLTLSSSQLGLYQTPVLYLTAALPVSGYLAYTGSSGSTDWSIEGGMRASNVMMKSIAVTYDGSASISSAIFYRNGYAWSSGGWNQVVASQSFSTTSSITASTTCTIGAVGAANPAQAQFGPMFMWTRALSPAEIAQVADPMLLGTSILQSSASQISTQDTSGTAVHVSVQLSPQTVDASTGGGGTTTLDPRVSKVNPGTN